MRIILIVLFFCVSCSTIDSGFLVKEANTSLAGVRAAIIAISGEPREISQNKREYTSQYFARKKGQKLDSNTTRDRLYAQFVILGDSRPYDIRVTVYLERKYKTGFELEGEDVVMTKQIAKELREKLNQGQDGRDMIDEFRPF